jgi:tripartite-type tricarboxylate transporter receptor subunit TctC
MLRRSLLAASLLLAAAPAIAQWVPKQPIKILVGYAPGGTADITARIAADTIQRQHGYPVIVDNKTGAGGFIALKQVAQSPPDGYTVGIGIMGQLAVGPVVPGSQIPLDLDKELVPICNLVGVPMALIVRMDAPFKTIPELVAAAKKGPLTYGSAGNGSVNHLLGEMFNASAGVKLQHVPYRGAAPAMNDLIAGHVPILFDNITTVIPQVKAGKVRALAVASAERVPWLPDVPTFAEAGLPEFEADSWFGLFAQREAPAETLVKTQADVTKVLTTPAVSRRLEDSGAIPGHTFGPEFDAVLQKERAKWSDVIRSSGANAPE